MGPIRIPSIPRSAQKISILEESIDATRSRKDPGLEIDESLGDESAAALQICLPGYAISKAFVEGKSTREFWSAGKLSNP